MNRLHRLVTTAVLALLPGLMLASPAAAKPVQDKDYKLVEPAQPQASTVKGVEVLEFFNYACPHCYEFEPHLRAWLKNKPKNADFRYVPAVFNDRMIPLAMIFYTLDEMNLLDKLHDKVYYAIHQQQVNLTDRATILKWMGEQGVDVKKFEATFDSFSINSKVQRARKMTRDYRIPGTPYLVVGGRYMTGPSMSVGSNNAVDYVRFEQILNELIDMSKGGAR
ncbi:MAG TPA: thiol:disulfide interchange protein DsbA/DsbL [Burkholderiales bacterium]|nr:thiol:disulfide interchange protein DsbA/DsbL [Burkholderiales bacterium]